MADLSDFKRGQIVGACMAGAELFYLAKTTVSKVMTVFEKANTFLLKQNSGRKRKLYDRDRRTLTRIFRTDQKNTASKITADPISRTQFPQKL